jgi:hypothetical protein
MVLSTKFEIYHVFGTKTRILRKKKVFFDDSCFFRTVKTIRNTQISKLFIAESERSRQRPTDSTLISPVTSAEHSDKLAPKPLKTLVFGQIHGFPPLCRAVAPKLGPVPLFSLADFERACRGLSIEPEKPKKFEWEVSR